MNGWGAGDEYYCVRKDVNTDRGAYSKVAFNGEPMKYQGGITNGSNWYRTYTNMVDVGNTLIVTISNLMVDPTYYFSVTAYDTNGLESDYSGEIMYKVPVVINPSNLPPTTTTNFQIIPKP